MANRPSHDRSHRHGIERPVPAEALLEKPVLPTRQEQPDASEAPGDVRKRSDDLRRPRRKETEQWQRLPRPSSWSTAYGWRLAVGNRGSTTPLGVGPECSPAAPRLRHRPLRASFQRLGLGRPPCRRLIDPRGAGSGAGDPPYPTPVALGGGCHGPPPATHDSIPPLTVPADRRRLIHPSTSAR
jgi:hypothetical protein